VFRIVQSWTVHHEEKPADFLKECNVLKFAQEDMPMLTAVAAWPALPSDLTNAIETIAQWISADRTM
jgi:hypothetical protein